MKKAFIFLIIIFAIVIVFKYRFSNYIVSYNIDNYKIKTIYRDKRFYYEINNGSKVFNFDIYAKRNLKLSRINKIEVLEDNNIYCVLPKIDNISTYPLCYLDNDYIDYNLLDSTILDDYKNYNNVEKPKVDFEYYTNLSENEYIALWNYKGYIVMNNKSYKNVDLFKKDKYDNTLSYLINENIYMANNDQEHEYDSLVVLNMKTLNHKTIKIGYVIDYDSYMVGNIKNNLYIFDNKHSILYEINIKNGKTKIIGNNEKGFIKYEDGKFVNCSKNDYKINKIKFNNSISNYNYSFNNGVYKTINENSDIKQLINKNKINIISEYNNTLYYQLGEYFYKYNPLYSSNEVFYNYELTFNNVNTIFVYNR